MSEETILKPSGAAQNADESIDTKKWDELTTWDDVAANTWGDSKDNKNERR